jgi:hypothetical protein
MSATWTSDLAEFRRRHERASKAALIAAALVYENAMKVALTGGYKSGAFVTGRVRSSVTHGEPYPIGPAQWAIRVGTNVLYALFWEIGHINLFSRRYERVEKWRPTLVEQRVRIAAKYSEIYTALMARPA